MWTQEPSSGEDGEDEGRRRRKRRTGPGLSDTDRRSGAGVQGGLGVGAFPPLNSRMLGGGSPRAPFPFGGRHA